MRCQQSSHPLVGAIQQSVNRTWVVDSVNCPRAQITFQLCVCVSSLAACEVPEVATLVRGPTWQHPDGKDSETQGAAAAAGVMLALC
jgi:hypothetical protein